MTIQYKKGVLYIEDVALDRIAEQFGTPTYCYSASEIIKNFRSYETALKRVMDRKNFTICYACKANSNIAVIKLLKKQGAGADIVSGGELQRAVKAGIDPKKIVFSGVGKSLAELTEAVRLGLLQINVESEEEIETIAKIAKKLKKTARVALRVNPDVDAKTHAKITTGKKENKFGIDIRQAPALYRKMQKLPYVEATGVAVHIGSQLTSLVPFRKAYARVAKLVETLRRQGNVITQVDLGGGIGIRYKDEAPVDLNLYALAIAETVGDLGVHVILEPGRSIVGNAGILLARVRHIKKGRNKKFLILDAGMNDLVRPAMYDAHHDIIPFKKGKKTTTYDIVGPVCETGDTFLTSHKTYEMKPGDLVALLSAGAYGASMASQYNTRPLAAEVLVKGKKHAAIRKRESIADIIKHETTPNWV